MIVEKKLFLALPYQLTQGMMDPKITICSCCGKNWFKLASSIGGILGEVLIKKKKKNVIKSQNILSQYTY